MVKKIVKLIAVISAVFLVSNFSCFLPYGALYINTGSFENSEDNAQNSFTGAYEKFTGREKQYVYVGGMPLGLELNTRGLIIIGKTDVITQNGLVNPTKNSNIEIGDILMYVNNTEINTAGELKNIVNDEENRGRELSASLKRHGQDIQTKICSALDAASGVYKTGLWVRQDTFGVGTLSFIRRDLRFASLGHPVVDGDTKDILILKSGRVLNCSIAGCVKGERGKPGELKGMIIKDSQPFGSVDKNGIFGLYGNLNAVIKNDLYPELIEIMPRSQVKPGKAYILTTLNGSQPEKFEIDIIKTSYQAKPADRSMVIKITDIRLLSVTGGIVQGMSGSPIIQNEKLCGAVTHVFINDPSRGYGLYADWMINQ